MNSLEYLVIVIIIREIKGSCPGIGTLYYSKDDSTTNTACATFGGDPQLTVDACAVSSFGHVTSRTDVLSPGGTCSDYGSNTNCQWNVTKPANVNTISILVNSFYVERDSASSCSFDSVRFLCQDSQAIKLCGYGYKGQIWNFQTSLLKIAFTSDSTLEYKGFNLTTSFVNMDILAYDSSGTVSTGPASYCEGNHTDSSDTVAACSEAGLNLYSSTTILSPGGTCVQYPKGSKCRWRYPIDSVDLKIIVNFFDVEHMAACNYDRLLVLQNDTQVMSMCGNGHEGKEYFINGSNIEFYFLSDFDYNVYGFNISVEVLGAVSSSKIRHIK